MADTIGSSESETESFSQPTPGPVPAPTIKRNTHKTAVVVSITQSQLSQQLQPSNLSQLSQQLQPSNPYAHLDYTTSEKTNPYEKPSTTMSTPQNVVRTNERTPTPLPPINSFSRATSSPFRVIPNSPSPSHTPTNSCTSPPLRQLNIDKFFSSSCNSVPSTPSKPCKRSSPSGSNSHSNPSTPTLKRTRLMSVEERQEMLEEEFDYRHVEGLGK
ncbi:hypothetical protein TrST_g6243 [Triparma strigata]|uniref:Uncharacterized protein n=1 Tax=Triparma strigata TaxID=1606541 RepID=A0A9W7BAA0_9STRA|nr:hypothetical protein TrST_g6243 [Triparma strigata]